MSNSPLEKKIAERQGRLDEVQGKIAELEMERIRLEAELCAYRDAVQYLSSTPKVTRKRTVSSGGRGGLSDIWKELLRRASNRSADQFNVDAILSVAEHIEHPMQRNTVRAQCANFVNRDLLTRVSDGWFALTPKGAKEVGVDLLTNGISGSAEPEKANTESVGTASGVHNPQPSPPRTQD